MRRSSSSLIAASALLGVLFLCQGGEELLSSSLVVEAYNAVNIPQQGGRFRDQDSSRRQQEHSQQQDPPLWSTWKKIEATRRHLQQEPHHPPQPTQQQQSQQSQPRNENTPHPERHRIFAQATLPDREYNRYRRTVPDKDISNIFRQNQEWKHGKLRQDPFFFKKLGSVHKPRYMWIGTFVSPLHWLTE